jgi:general secretion pathway protein F
MEKFMRWLLGPIWHLAFHRVRSMRQTTLLWALATAVEKNIPVEPFLESLGEEAGGRWRKQLRGLADLLFVEVSIPDAIDAMPHLLPADTRMLIRLGAESGQLSQALREAAVRCSRQGEEGDHGSMADGLVYLCAIVILMAHVVGFIMYWIVPKFKAIFSGFDIELPEVTILIIDLANTAGKYFLLLVPVSLVLLVLAAAVSFELMGIESLLSRPLSKLARWFPRLRAPLVLRGLGLAVDGGCPLPVALETLATRHPDKNFRYRLQCVDEAVTRGADCWIGLQGVGLLRAGEVAILGAAERAGNLSWALRGLADSIERRAMHRSRIVYELLRPLGLLVVGLMVGLFVVGMFMPIVQLVLTLS